ncbi:hypothetical protein Pint_27174 [Pistacia integerrima]|uniref:Uncharacterized protein n=1 Tax=Pistacia integerrima TaxID=434235 RepID=A0ACC0YTL5_9ROSI|nr:hypothetical protein Pint_27174 [Pistacia integerrima]
MLTNDLLTCSNQLKIRLISKTPLNFSYTDSGLLSYKPII